MSRLLLLTGLVAFCLGQEARQGRGFLEDAERLLGHINSGIDTLQTQAGREIENLRPWAAKVEKEMAPTMDRVEQSLGSAFHHVMRFPFLGSSPAYGQERVGAAEEDSVPSESAPAEVGSGISMEHLLDQFAGQPLDPFRIFGVSRRRWFEGPNVCVDRKVIDESNEEGSSSGEGAFMMDMTMTSCRDGDNFHECTTRINTNGRKKTVVVNHACCYGYDRANPGAAGGADTCQKVDLKEVRETVAELEGQEFLELVKSLGLEEEIKGKNVTLFVPTNEAVEDFRRDLEGLNAVEDNAPVSYSIDDGLVSRKKRSELQVVEGPRLVDIVRNHLVSGLFDTSKMHDEEITDTLSKDAKLRINVYPSRSERVVMANCARLTSKDHRATDGMVHTVDRVILPATKTVGELLEQDDRFRTLTKVLKSAGLFKDLAESTDENNSQVTIFAPTDAAFAKLDSATREKIMTGNGCAQDILNHHLLPNVICSGAVAGKARTVNSNNKYITLERNPESEDVVTIDGVRITTADVVGTNGVIQVVEEVLIPETARSVDDALKERKSDTLRELMELAGITEGVDALANTTLFAPSEEALKELPQEYMDDLKGDKKKLTDFLMYHVATPKMCKCDFEDGKVIETGLEGKRLRMNVYETVPANMFDFRPRRVSTVQCAKLTKLDDEVCGGMIHTVEKVLLPPAGKVLEILKHSGNKFTKFLELVSLAGMEEELEKADATLTVLAPTDEAFQHLKVKTSEAAFGSADSARQLVERHVIKDSSLCCAGIPRQVPFLDLSGWRTQGGEVVSLRRSRGGHLYADRAEVHTCDMVAENGVAHAIDRVLVPETLLYDEEELQRRAGQQAEMEETKKRRNPFFIFNLFK